MTNCYPKKAENLACRILKGEAIIMNPVDSSLFSLNETATAIWNAIDGRTALRDIVEHEVCPKFEIDPASALRDARELVESLASHSILVLKDTAWS